MHARKSIRRYAFAFFHSDYLIYGNILQNVLRAAGPSDFKSVDARLRSQSKIDPWILRRAKAHPAFRLVETHTFSRRKLQSCADAVPIALGTNEFYS